MTTPEQLQAWREEFEAPYHTMDLSLVERQRNGEPAEWEYYELSLETCWRGYLRRCQETEQALKSDDQQIALFVNSLTKLVEDYHVHPALRHRISSEIVPLFYQCIKNAHKLADSNQ